MRKMISYQILQSKERRKSSRRCARIVCHALGFSFLLINQCIFLFLWISILVIGIAIRAIRSVSKRVLLRLSLKSEVQHGLYPAPGAASSEALPDFNGSRLGLSDFLLFPAWPPLFFSFKTKPRYILKAYILEYLTTSASEGKKRNQCAVVLPVLNVRHFSVKHTPINFPFHFLN